MSTDEKRKLCDAIVTLDGKPAVIRGALLPFAIVGTLDGKQAYEWSWETVARIVAKGGAFRS